MVIVSDTTAGREMNYGVTSGKDIYEKYRFGAAMLNLDVRADTGKINSSPVATLPGEFLMQASCKNSYTVSGSLLFTMLKLQFLGSNERPRRRYHQVSMGNQ